MNVDKDMRPLWLCWLGTLAQLLVGLVRPRVREDGDLREVIEDWAYDAASPLAMRELGWSGICGDNGYALSDAEWGFAVRTGGMPRWGVALSESYGSRQVIFRRWRLLFKIFVDFSRRVRADAALPRGFVRRPEDGCDPPVERGPFPGLTWDLPRSGKYYPVRFRTVAVRFLVSVYFVHGYQTLTAAG